MSLVRCRKEVKGNQGKKLQERSEPIERYIAEVTRKKNKNLGRESQIETRNDPE